MLFLRVDDNLLHGSIAFSWVRGLKIHQILIADDLVVKDEFLKMSLGLAKPKGVQLKTVSINDLIGYFKNEGNPSLNTLVIVRNLRYAKKITDQITSIRSVNIGLNRSLGEVLFQHNGAFLDEEAYQTCIELDESGIEIEFRLKYDDPVVYFSDIQK